MYTTFGLYNYNHQRSEFISNHLCYKKLCIKNGVGNMTTLWLHFFWEDTVFILSLVYVTLEIIKFEGPQVTSLLTCRLGELMSQSQATLPFPLEMHLRVKGLSELSDAHCLQRMPSKYHYVSNKVLWLAEITQSSLDYLKPGISLSGANLSFPINQELVCATVFFT